MDKYSKILVTGAKGMLGYDCVKELNNRGYNNISGIDIEDLDLTDEVKTISYITEFMPDVIIHTAAYTAVDKAENDIDNVYKINALAPKYIAEAANICGAKMVYFSTDYVFDGKGDKPYEIDEKTSGLSVYAKSKAEGEKNIMSSVDSFFIIRTSWLFGKNGNNFVKTMLRLADMGKTELNVVDDQIGSVTYSVDLAKIVCDLIETEKYGIYHITNEGFISWADFAEEIFKQKGLNVKVNPVSTEEYMKLVSNQAKRPLNSRLSKKSLDDNGFNRLPDWKDALNRYLKEIEENE